VSPVSNPTRSNPTRRVIQILDFLAARPGRGYGLAELCRSLTLSKSTCIAIVSELTAAGYLIQDPTTRAYRLGPALITGGQAVLSRFPDIRPGLGVLESAAVALGLSCSVVGAADERIVVLARVGSPDPFHGLTRVGGSIPFVPPWGAALVAWGSDTELDEWLARAPSTLSGAQAKALRRSLRAGRQRGYFVVREPPQGSAFHRDLVRLRDQEGTDEEALRRLLARLDYYIDEFSPKISYALDHLDVPILLGEGAAPLSFLTTLFGRKLPGEDIKDIARQMTQATVRCAELISSRG